MRFCAFKLSHWGGCSGKVFDDLIEGGEDGTAICINEGEPGRAEYEEHNPVGPSPKVLQQRTTHSQNESETDILSGVVLVDFLSGQVLVLS